MTNVAPCMNLKDWPLFEMPSTEETEDVHWSCLDRKGNNFSSSHFCGVKPIFPRQDKILLRFSVFAPPAAAEYHHKDSDSLCVRSGLDPGRFQQTNNDSSPLLWHSSNLSSLDLFLLFYLVKNWYYSLLY